MNALNMQELETRLQAIRQLDLTVNMLEAVDDLRGQLLRYEIDITGANRGLRDLLSMWQPEVELHAEMSKVVTWCLTAQLAERETALAAELAAHAAA
jgi:dTDP-D-glucose 4,6-dehydratase